MAHSARLLKEAHATLAWTCSHPFRWLPRKEWSRVLDPVNPCCPFSTTAIRSQPRLPYFHKKLTKSKDAANSTTATDSPDPTSHSSSSSESSSSSTTTTTTTAPRKTDTTGATTSQNGHQETLSNRQKFRSIVPDPQIMLEIRSQGLGANAQMWKFEGRSTNKTIRPGDKKLSREEYKAQQREKRLPPRQVWFDTQTSKVVEKEEVRFPTMRFMAGAATIQSIPNEMTLLRLARPYLFEELDSLNVLLELQESPNDDSKESEKKKEQLHGGRRGEEEDGSSDGNTLSGMAPPTPEQIQQWQAKKREQEARLRDKYLKEIAVVGRSNVGKSTLLNALTESPNTARVSDKPGLTRQLNFYRCGEKFALVDMPGYGFAFANEEDKRTWSELIGTYVTKRKTLKRIYLMIDARHGLKVADRDFMDLLDKGSTKFQVILTKCDLVPPPDLARRYTTVLEELKKSYRNAIKDRLIMVSSYTGAGMNNLRKDILWTCNLDILVRERERPQSTM